MLPETLNKLISGLIMARAWAWCGMALIAAGCTAGSYNRLREAAPEAGDFNHSLAAEYLAYAEAQSELGHSGDADYFANKGIRAIDDETVEPEPAKSGPLLDARKRLQALLTTSVKRVLPQQAARAQLLYDCWQHQQVQIAASQDDSCSQEFHAVADELENVEDTLTIHTKSKYLLQFTDSDTALTTEMQSDLDQVAAATKDLDDFQVQLSSMVGNGSDHDRISEARLQIISEALIDRGIGATYIVTHDAKDTKTVYLSHDRKEQPKNSVIIRIKAVDKNAGD